MSLPTFKGWILDEPNLYVESNLPQYFEKTWALRILFIINKQLHTLYEQLKYYFHPQITDNIKYGIIEGHVIYLLKKYFAGHNVEIKLKPIGGVRAVYSNQTFSNKKRSYPRNRVKSLRYVEIEVISDDSSVYQPNAFRKSGFNALCRRIIPVNVNFKIKYTQKV